MIFKLNFFCRKIGKCYTETKNILTNNPFSVYTLFKDNSAVV